MYSTYSVSRRTQSPHYFDEFTVNESPKAPTTAISYGVNLLTIKNNFKMKVSFDVNISLLLT